MDIWFIRGMFLIWVCGVIRTNCFGVTVLVNLGELLFNKMAYYYILYNILDIYKSVNKVLINYTVGEVIVKPPTVDNSCLKGSAVRCIDQ